jgi:hypothetical protein
MVDAPGRLYRVVFRFHDPLHLNTENPHIDPMKDRARPATVMACEAEISASIKNTSEGR